MCSRCQRVGHSSSNCHLDFRCVKCAENHEPGNCAIKKEIKIDKTQIYCVRCKMYGHPATYKGCIKYKEIKDRFTKNRIRKNELNNTTLRDIKKSLTTHYTHPNVLYSQILQKKEHKTLNQHNTETYTQKQSKPTNTYDRSHKHTNTDTNNRIKRVRYTKIAQLRKSYFPEHTKHKKPK